MPQSWAQARLTLVLAVATALVFVLIEAGGQQAQATLWGSFIPAPPPELAGYARAPAWATPLTAAFLHFNWLHLLLNLLFLVVCGRPTEAVIGPIGFGLLYLLGAYAAAAGHYLLEPASPYPMIGASGAISAVVGAYAILFGRNKVKVASPRLAIALNALWLMATWVAIQLAVGITFGGLGIGIAVGAHIGGFMIGVILANPLLLLRYRNA